jgi:hypothetical protein
MQKRKNQTIQMLQQKQQLKQQQQLRQQQEASNAPIDLTGNGVSSAGINQVGSQIPYNQQQQPVLVQQPAYNNYPPQIPVTGNVQQPFNAPQSQTYQPTGINMPMNMLQASSGSYNTFSAMPSGANGGGYTGQIQMNNGSLMAPISNNMMTGNVMNMRQASMRAYNTFSAMPSGGSCVRPPKVKGEDDDGDEDEDSASDTEERSSSRSGNGGSKKKDRRISSAGSGGSSKKRPRPDSFEDSDGSGGNSSKRKSTVQTTKVAEEKPIAQDLLERMLNEALEILRSYDSGGDFSVEVFPYLFPPFIA